MGKLSNKERAKVLSQIEVVKAKIERLNVKIKLMQEKKAAAKLQ